MPISEGFRRWLSPAGCMHGKRWKQYICHQHPTYAFYKHFVSIVTSSAVPCRHHGQQNQIVLKAKCNHNLFICLHNFQPIVKCQNNLHVFWLTGSVQVLTGDVTSSHIDLSVTSCIFITGSGSGQGI